MKPVVVRRIRRASLDIADAYAEVGVATAHEAYGRRGYLGADLTPVVAGVRIAGPAVTVLCWPGDNLMLHSAIELCQPGDIVVLTTVSPSSDGYIGELLATSLAIRGVRGVVTTTGVRDVADLRAMGFPTWSRHVSAQGTGKASAGSVNIPVTVGATVVHAGDLIVADDDGVQCIARQDVEATLAAARRRIADEAETRIALAAGALTLDRSDLRRVVTELGTVFVD